MLAQAVNLPFCPVITLEKIFPHKSQVEGSPISEQFGNLKKEYSISSLLYYYLYSLVFILTDS